MSILRSLWRTPGFFLAAVLTLALGIGANVASFSVIRAVLLKPLGYREADRLVLLSGGASPAHFSELKAGAHSYASIGAYALEEDLAFSGHAAPEVVKTNRVSGNFLEILGVSPLLGRGFAGPDDSVLISYKLWQRYFDGDLHVLGRSMDLAGKAYTISGVLPLNFAFPSADIDVWLAKPEDSPQFSPESRALSPFLSIFGRLKPGVSFAQATAELVLLQAAYAKNHPAMLDAKPKSPVTAKPLQRVVIENVELELWLLSGAVGLVLLIACANLASLLLARAAARWGEFAVRAALGASRARIVRQLLAESCVLALHGGVAGALLAFFSLSALRRFGSLGLPRANEIQFDGVVLAFAVALTLFTSILFGLTPSLAASRVDLMTVLRSSRGASVRFGLRSVIVSGQIALSVVLLIGTTMLVESIFRLRAEPLGFDSQNLLTGRIALPLGANPARFFDDLLQRVSALPGVQHASVSLSLPMTSYPGTPVQNASQPLVPLNQRPLTALFIVSSDYFETLRIPLKRGRTFNGRDRDGAPRVAIIDENLARHFWPAYPAGQNPVGQRLLIGGVNKVPAEIVGIVANAHQNLEGTGWDRSVYVAFGQGATPSAMLAIRVASNPASFESAVRRTVQAINPAQPVSDLEPMQELIETELGSRNLLMKVLGLFSLSALALALSGVFGLFSYSVTQRTRELGIRRALGAPENKLLRMVLTQALRLALTGVLIGVVFAYSATNLMKSFLFHTATTDPVAYIGASAIFITIAAAAAFAPALRAARTDPVRALRHE